MRSDRVANIAKIVMHRESEFVHVGRMKLAVVVQDLKMRKVD